jgi:hypothetical protein
MTRRDFLATLPAAALAATARANSSYALLDASLISRSTNTQLSVGPVTKDPKPLFAEDKPWEVRIDNVYANVLYDDRDRRFKCWYSPFIKFDDRWDGKRWVKAGDAASREMAICYADSEDGIRWRKPELGLVEFEGNRRNNMVWRTPHGSGIFLDRHDSDPARRFKIFFNAPDPDGTHRERETAMSVAFSADGLHWSQPTRCPGIDARGDTHNNAFWDARSGKYIGFTRLVRPDAEGHLQRTVGRTESPDFLHWTKAEPVLQGSVEHQTYAMPVMPYHHGYLGLVMIFHTVENTVDCELAWSADTRQWKRIAAGSALIPRGPEGAHDHGCIFAAAYPIVRPEGTVLFYGGNDRGHNGPRKGFFCRAQIRNDGFAGIAPQRKSEPATLQTVPITVSGRKLRITADAANGQIRAGIANSEKHRLDACRPVAGDLTNSAVEWKTARDLSSLQGKTVQLELELRGATAYTVSFGD